MCCALHSATALQGGPWYWPDHVVGLLYHSLRRPRSFLLGATFLRLLRALHKANHRLILLSLYNAYGHPLHQMAGASPAYAHGGAAEPRHFVMPPTLFCEICGIPCCSISEWLAASIMSKRHFKTYLPPPYAQQQQQHQHQHATQAQKLSQSRSPCALSRSSGLVWAW